MSAFDAWWEVNNRSLPVHNAYEFAKAVTERFGATVKDSSVQTTPHTDPAEIEAGTYIQGEIEDALCLSVFLSDKDRAALHEYQLRQDAKLTHLKNEVERLKEERQVLAGRVNYMSGRIAELEAQLESEKQMRAQSSKYANVHAMYQEMQSLRAQLAQASADTGRLDWLEKSGCCKASHVWLFARTLTGAQCPTLREAIDAALPAPPAPVICRTCDGRGEIGGPAWQTPENVEYVTEPCPDCTPAPVTEQTDHIVQHGVRVKTWATSIPEQNHIPDTGKMVSQTDAPAVEPGEGWKLLRDGEMIQRGDEMHATIDDLWIPSVAAGAYPQPGMAYRRRITEGEA